MRLLLEASQSECKELWKYVKDNIYLKKQQLDGRGEVAGKLDRIQIGIDVTTLCE
mgnify:FL=1